MGQSGGSTPGGPRFDLWMVIVVIAIIFAGMTASLLDLHGWTIFLIFVYAIGIKFAISTYDEHQKKKNK